MGIFGLRQPLRSLARMQSRAALSRALKRFRSPRRMFLTIISVVLAVIWIGQALAGVLLRESADPEKLRQWLPLSLAGYALWNVVKVLFRKPEAPFAWTPAEEELLLAAPLTRTELIQFRFMATVRAALAKASIFSLVMIPDLQFLPFGFAGMMVGLLLIDLFRMLAEVVVWGLRKREHLIVKVVVGTCIACLGGYLVIGSLQTVAGGGLQSIASLGFLMSLVNGALEASQTMVGRFVLTPYRMLADVILGGPSTPGVLLKILATIVSLVALVWSLVRLDHVFDSRRRLIETEKFPLLKREHNDRELHDRIESEKSLARPRRKPLRMGGVGPLGWRQLIGAKKYRSQLLLALIVPAILSCLPALTGLTDMMLLMNVTGGLAFYSFLLLPSSMPFDLRRDLKRMTVLKSLPISPLKIVLGQITAPFLLTTFFQVATLLVTICISPFHPVYLLVSMSILVPFNLFIFGLENLLILWYPYRLNQEGIQVFIRSILSFTAKGLFFAVAAAGVLTWAFVAKWSAEILMPDSPRGMMALLFSVGGFFGVLLVASTVIGLLTHSYKRFDPSCDLAGLD